MWLALLLISAFLAWLLQYKLFQKNWYKGLDVRVEFSSPSIFEGESSSLKEVVTNDKHLPILAVSVRLAFSRNLEFLKAAKENSGISDHTYKRDIFSLLPKQRITRKLPFVGKKRGLYSIGNADVSGFDYFFQKGFYCSFEQDAYLYVYPRFVSPERIRLVSNAISGMMLCQNKLFWDPFEFSGIRDYRKEDPLNHINWKASARTGELMVNQFDATTEYNVTILLDLEDPYILKYEALLEESIRIAASLCAQLLRNKMPVRVLSDCAVKATADCPGSPLHMELSAAGGKITPLLQALACLDTGCIPVSMGELIDGELAENRAQAIYVVISKNQSSALVSKLQALAAGHQLLWICPVTDCDIDRNQYSNFSVLYWEVAS